MTLLKFQKNHAVPRSFEALVSELISDVFQKENKPQAGLSYFEPAVNILEREKNYSIELALPGWNKKDVELSLENKVLVIKGQKEEKNSDRSVVKREFGYGQFEKRF